MFSVRRKIYTSVNAIGFGVGFEHSLSKLSHFLMFVLSQIIIIMIIKKILFGKLSGKEWKEGVISSFPWLLPENKNECWLTTTHGTHNNHQTWTDHCSPPMMTK